MSPKVTFIVPCYKLAHLLPDCIDSILRQTYRDFEILIMDDCSPDNTREVAQTFSDPRVKYIRNDPNLGHLNNYNKGIGLAQGKYVWLISADDRLRREYALERYVQLMEEHPNVGYVFCPVMSLVDGRDAGMVDWTMNGDRDEIINGRSFLGRLAKGNSVPAASGLVRRECYEKVSVFPLDLPDAGDWYLWCIFALHFDVAYFSEPMVSYRLHQQSMTNQMSTREHFADDLAVRWRVKRLAQEKHLAPLARKWRKSVASVYGKCLISARVHSGEFPLSFDEFEESVREQSADAAEARDIRALTYALMGDGYYDHEDFAEALLQYRKALQVDFWAPTVWAKIILLRMGKAGTLLRNMVREPRPAAPAAVIENPSAVLNSTSSLHAGRKYE